MPIAVYFFQEKKSKGEFEEKNVFSVLIVNICVCDVNTIR